MLVVAQQAIVLTLSLGQQIPERSNLYSFQAQLATSSLKLAS